MGGGGSTHLGRLIEKIRFFYDFSKLGFFCSSDSNARQKYKSEIKNFSRYILLLEFLSLSLMSPARSVSEKKKQMTLRLSGSSDLKVKRYRGGGVFDEENA